MYCFPYFNICVWTIPPFAGLDGTAGVASDLLCSAVRSSNELEGGPQLTARVNPVAASSADTNRRLEPKARAIVAKRLSGSRACTFCLLHSMCERPWPQLWPGKLVSLPANPWIRR